MPITKRSIVHRASAHYGRLTQPSDSISTLACAFRKSTGTSNSRCRRVQLLHWIALDARGVQDKYSSRECGIGSGSVRECGFDRRAFLSLQSEGGIQMNNTTQQLEALQRMMVADSAALQDNVRSFWDVQDKALDAMENLANGWFERRHVGTHAALEAAQRMCKAQTPADLVREYQDWVGGAFQRVMADWVACQEFFVFAAPLSGKQKTTPQQPETKTVQHSKAA